MQAGDEADLADGSNGAGDMGADNDSREVAVDSQGSQSGAEGAEDQADSAECEAPPSAQLHPAASCGEDSPATPPAMADAASAGTEVCFDMDTSLA